MFPLESVTITDFRAIARMELRLHSRLTVLYGLNGEGKTTVLDGVALALLPLVSRKVLEPRWVDPEGDLRSTWTDGRRETADFVRAAAKPSRGVAWSVTLQPALLGVQSPVDDPERVAGWSLSPSGAPKLKGEPLRHEHLDLFAFYGTHRAVLDVSLEDAPAAEDLTRLGALRGALNATARFTDLFHWFRAMEEEENRQIRDRKDLDHRLPELQAVREALVRAMPRCANPRIASRPLRLVVDFSPEQGPVEELSLQQLSNGYRTHLALVMDLARRMVQANPFRADGEAWGLDEPSLVLIDEVDLHLHPRWQQQVLPSLLAAFPHAQFIVTTHSDQVLSSVPADALVLHLQRGAEGLEAVLPPIPLHAASSERVLERAMQVNPRPPGETRTLLERYLDLVDEGEGEGEDARALRRALESKLDPDDPELLRADVRIRRRRAFARP
ncbi:MAG: AAA family ATPase [Alphaproteobacteria bacterium]|nr:AAA family ATPase [Alphaproteobacteria bacterium]MCB9792109.1 AAA family ATPase [Alphaproteobacteria bacterium]